MSYFQASFDARSAAVRVRFGAGVRHQLLTRSSQLGCKRALVLSTPPQADSAMEMAADLKGLAAGVFTKAAMHTPVAVTEEAMEHARSRWMPIAWSHSAGDQPRGLARPSPIRPIFRRSSFRPPMPAARRRHSGPDRKRRKNHGHRPENPAGSHSLRCRTGAHVACGDDGDERAQRHGPCRRGALCGQNRNPMSTMLAIEGLRAFAARCPG
jgi:maleylacetate reductase